MQTIPLVDIRDSSPVSLLETNAESARTLIHSSRGTFGRLAEIASYAALPLGDWLAKRWLRKTNNPYASEIEAFAKRLGVSGVYALNLVYECGCTSGVYATPDGPRLLRVLDWPFKGLGQHMLVTHQRGAAGDFHNVTWPAVSGVFTATAQGRFAVALNQAPMRRHKTGIYRDWFTNRFWVNKAKGLPPAHLLRKVCETARDYEEAKDMLMREPIAIPVIYILAGTKNGEGCVIERLEEGAAMREMGGQPSVTAANHFLSHINALGYGWMPREIDSFGRAVCAGTITSAQATDPQLKWLKPPIANVMSRLCFSACPATGSMSLLGLEGEMPVTELFRLTLACK
jgi:hypothetical protein